MKKRYKAMRVADRRKEGYTNGFDFNNQLDPDMWEIYDYETIFAFGTVVAICPDKVLADKIIKALEIVQLAKEV